jgi:hypothetical protein
MAMLAVFSIGGTAHAKATEFYNLTLAETTDTMTGCGGSPTLIVIKASPAIVKKRLGGRLGPWAIRRAVVAVGAAETEALRLLRAWCSGPAAGALQPPPGASWKSGAP